MASATPPVPLSWHMSVRLSLFVMWTQINTHNALTKTLEESSSPLAVVLEKLPATFYRKKWLLETSVGVLMCVSHYYIAMSTKVKPECLNQWNRMTDLQTAQVWLNCNYNTRIYSLIFTFHTIHLFGPRKQAHKYKTQKLRACTILWVKTYPGHCTPN